MSNASSSKYSAYPYIADGKCSIHTSVYHYQSYETTDKHAFLAFGFGFFRLCL